MTESLLVNGGGESGFLMDLLEVEVEDMEAGAVIVVEEEDDINISKKTK